MSQRVKSELQKMLSIQKADVTPHQPPFYVVKPLGSLTLICEKERKQDANLNILEVDYDRNENWRQEKKMLDDPETKLKEDEEMSSVEDNRNHLKKKALGQLKVTKSEGISLSSSDEEEEEIRSPPEGAEILQLVGEKPPNDTTIQGADCPTSPLEDNGYASSSLSIESPDSISGNIWEDTPIQAENPQDEADTEQSDVESSSDSESLSHTLVEAYQSLQDREMLKEREKEKHHAQLTMYRRLALLRWIRCLQQKVRDQQNRLQESFDTILDNRKEILRHIQHGSNKGLPAKEAA
uniref:Chromosome 1 open reading frame 216 n=1 Tax=Leptobrachium leishanense TaxID=445787 RepID=A0A8C5LJ73_9ANUR